MTAVRSPQLPVFASHHDQRIEEYAGLVDALGQTLGMCRREVALEGRRLDRRERERGDEERPTAQGFAICADRRPAGFPDLRNERREILMSQIEGSFFSGNAARLLTGGQAASGAFPCTRTG